MYFIKKNNTFCISYSRNQVKIYNRVKKQLILLSGCGLVYCKAQNLFWVGNNNFLCFKPFNKKIKVSLVGLGFKINILPSNLFVFELGASHPFFVNAPLNVDCKQVNQNIFISSIECGGDAGLIKKTLASLNRKSFKKNKGFLGLVSSVAEH